MDSYKSLINHVFLPPELPQSSDGVAFDTLLGSIIESLAAYKLLRTDEEATLEASIRMTSSMRYSHIEEFIDEKKLAELLHDLPRQGGAILLYISAQNAGMIISRFSDLGSDLAVRFEAFELSPRNNAVYQEAGRLHRSFPGSAIDIELKAFAETGLVDTVARTLAKMSHQAAPGMQPQARKAGTSMDEDRDTTHPGMISEFFMGFLSAAGHPAQVNTISKNTREEVLWRDARSPWRRSPVWMLLRVALQLNLPRDLYKEFIVFMMSMVIDDSRNQHLSSDLRYAMMAKVARRVFKLPSPGNANVVRHVQNALQNTTAALEEQWLRLQTQAPLDLSGLAGLDFERDGSTALPALDAYLKAVSGRQGGQPVNDFQPKSGLVVFDPQALPRLTNVDSHRDYTNQNLHAFELWVAAHMAEWRRTHLDDANACERLHALVRSYHELTSRHYNGNPEAISVAVLTVFQIWVALDACALNLCPLIGEYEPGLSLNIAQNLLLPCKNQMRRLSEVEAYVARREENAALASAKILYDITPDCFSGKYFDLSSDHQALCASIEAQAAREKEAKIEELARQKSEYARLMSLHQEADCAYYEYVLERANLWMEHDVTEQRHSHSCQKCAYKAQANRLHIGIHEWPLPSTTTLRKAVVFELQPPSFFVHWRDSLTFLIVNVLGLTHTAKPDPRAKYHLAMDAHLSRRQHKTPSQRVGMLSEVKPHVVTHRRDLPIVTASEFTVCLANGLSYKYYDSDVGTFVNGFVSTDKVALACTYKLPQRSTALQNFINRLAADLYGQTPNTVIASLSECPDHMSLDEYKKLSSIPCGWHLQWPNLLIQLGFPAINFKNVETTLVLLQCIYQSGPAGDDVLREGHGFCGHYESAAKLLEELDIALQRIKKNWESSQALTIFINIASRLLSLSSSTTIHTACLTYLVEGRAIAFGWMHDLEEKAQQISTHKERNEYMSKRAEIALICVDSFNVDDIPLADILSSSEQASILLQCSIVVQESRLLLGASKEPTVSLLLLRSQRLIHRCYRTLASDGAAIDAGISRSWTGFQPRSPWTATGSDHWLTTSTGAGLAGIILQVHFNILTGELLVNGLPLDRLPRKYEDHGSYRTLFGNSAIEVMPTATPGMDFAAKRMYSGHELDFGWGARADTATNDLLVRAYKSGKCYELIPSRLFSEIFPAAFIQDRVHWYNLDENVVEFRPIDQLWDDLCPRAWRLVHDPDTTRWRLTKDATSQILLSLTSATSMVLSRLLSPMADATSIHIISQPSSHQDSQAQPVRSRFIQREVEVELPGPQLGFILKANAPTLESKEFPSMAFDPDQSLNTLVGLQNRLLLRHRHHGTRLLLILDGDVTYNRDEQQHVAVTIQKAVPGVSSTFHTFRVDAMLGRLIGSGDLQSKLFLIRLHSLTTHCLPDPLTRKTGTEQALSMLRSASVRSFHRLTEEDVKLLGKIAALTPVRQYYPENERDMQTVGWSSKLGFLAQHAGFRTGVESIMDQARRASMFYPGSTLKLPDLPRSDAGLMHRDSIRYAMLCVSGFGAEEFTTARDTPYRARDQHQASERFTNTFIMSSFVYQHKQNPHWNLPSNVAVSLWEALAAASPILGTLTSYPELQYDATLLETSYSTSVFPAWLELHRRLCAGMNKYALMMWLSTLACSVTKPVNTTVLQTLALSFTRLDMSRVLLPPVRDSFHLAKGKTVRKDELLTAVTSMLDFASSAESRMTRQMNEKKGPYEKRRKQAFRNATTPILEAVIDRLVAQWPCEVATAACLSSVHRISVYLDVNKVIHKVGPRFKAWYDNLQFFHYLERIGRIISTQSITQIEVSAPRLNFSSAIPSKPVRHVTQNDLFTGAGPTVTNNSAALIHLHQLVLRKNVTSSNNRLRMLVGRLEVSAAGSKYEKAYVNGLRDSSFALQRSQIEYNLRECDSIQQDLALHLEICQMQVDSVYELLMRAVSPQSIRQLDRATSLWSIKQWPRVSSTFFLEQLKRSRWSALSSHWRDAIVQYGIALTAFQRAERLLNVVRSGSDVDLISELRNTGHVNWSPHDYPESLLLEVESGVMIREVQEQIASQMRDSKGNAVMQLNMGEGKSSLIVPIVATDLANGSQLVRVVVAKPQSKQMAQMMISKLGGLLDRRVYYMPFSRALKLDKAAADAINAVLQECMSNGGILLVQPEHILSFKLMALEMGILGEESISKSLLRSQDFFDGFSRDLVDESDENFSVKFELIYTIGSQRPVELSPARWMCIHEILGLVRRFSQLTANDLPGSVELTHCLPGRFPRTRILKADAQDHLFLTVALHICTYGFNGFPIARQSQAVRDAVFKYIVKFDLTLKEIQSVEHTGPESFWTESTKEMLLLLRGLFAAGVLSFVFGQKRWRVNYGLDSSRTPDTKLAVPYRAKDNPSPRSEFSHPDVIIMLTTLSYYYGGLGKDDLATAFDHLTRSDQADTVFQAWVKDAHDMPAAFSQLQGINLRDKHQFAVELFPCLRFDKATIDYFLANIVFPKEMKEFPHKLSASGWDIGNCKVLPTTGFSGTNDSREVLPLFVEQIDLPAQKHTNALVLDYLLRDENSVAEIPAPTTVEVLTSDAERFLNMVSCIIPTSDTPFSSHATVMCYKAFVAVVW